MPTDITLVNWTEQGIRANGQGYFTAKSRQGCPTRSSTGAPCRALDRTVGPYTILPSIVEAPDLMTEAPRPTSWKASAWGVISGRLPFAPT